MPASRTYPAGESTPGARPESRMPRLMRRSMSYGPPADRGEADRGLLFMAYNTSFGEQFEVVQRWLAGGNSTGSSSGRPARSLACPKTASPAHYSFEYPGADGQPRVLNIELEKQAPLFDEPETITRLEWGLYLFTPSIAVLERLAQTAALAGEKGASRGLALEGRSRTRIDRIAPKDGTRRRRRCGHCRMEGRDRGSRIHRPARKRRVVGGDQGRSRWVLRTPYGVLVAGRELLCQVYQDKDRRYSVSGQMERMTRSIGPVSLGKDAGEEYDDGIRGDQCRDPRAGSASGIRTLPGCRQQEDLSDPGPGQQEGVLGRQYALRGWLRSARSCR